MEKMFFDELFKSDYNFSEFLNNLITNSFEKNADYIKLENKRSEILKKNPKVRKFIEEDKSSEFTDKEMELFSELYSIFYDKHCFELKEFYKAGAKDMYLFMRENNLLK